MFEEDLLKPFVLLGGLTASELWPTINFILPTWLLLAFLPHWKYTPKVTLIGPLLHAVIYTLGVISLLMDPTHNEGKAPDMSTFEGVVLLFQDPNGVFVGWIHYVVYDALIGRWIVLDAMDRGCSVLIHVLVIIPCLLLALLFGPMGWLLYVALIRTLVLPTTTTTTTTTNNKAIKRS
mmetsp:Transcript_69030/g.77218  ORF Transcript_69030/g.77218 Transcript_69030/m.77218 type:complete len:178 (+) Transcript_69030:241-774(+)